MLRKIVFVYFVIGLAIVLTASVPDFRMPLTISGVNVLATNTWRVWGIGHDSSKSGFQVSDAATNDYIIILSASYGDVNLFQITNILHQSGINFTCDVVYAESGVPRSPPETGFQELSRSGYLYPLTFGGPSEYLKEEARNVFYGLLDGRIDTLESETIAGVNVTYNEGTTNYAAVSGNTNIHVSFKTNYNGGTGTITNMLSSDSSIVWINSGGPQPDGSVTSYVDQTSYPRSNPSNYVDATLITGVSNAFRSADIGVSNAFLTADNTLSSQLVTAYSGADNTLSGQLVTAYSTADNTLSGQLVTAYRSADNTLSGQLVTAYGSADNTLSGQLVVAYSGADNTLSGQLVAVVSGLDTGISNAFRSADTGVSNAFRSADTVVSNSITSIDWSSHPATQLVTFGTSYLSVTNTPNFAYNSTNNTGYNWANPTNALEEDGIYAVVDGIPSETNTITELYINNFNFSIPETALINGIVVKIKGNRIGDGTSYVGLAKGYIEQSTSNGFYFSVGVAWITNGTATELWGLSWTAAEINSTNFAVRIGGITVGIGEGEKRIDIVKVLVYYSDNVATISTNGQGNFRTMILGTNPAISNWPDIESRWIAASNQVQTDLTNLKGASNLYIAADNTLSGQLVTAYSGADTAVSNSYTESRTWSGIMYTQVFAGVSTTGRIASTSADTNKYLRGDGTWATPAGAGDFKADGTVPMTGDFDGGGQDITNIANAKVTTLQITGGSPTNGALLLTTNTAGQTKWSPLVAFKATPDATVVIPATFTKLNYKTETYDYGNCYDAANSTFTAPVNGLYQFIINIWVTTHQDLFNFGALIYKNGGNAGGSLKNYSFTGSDGILMTLSLVLTNGTIIEPYGYSACGATNSASYGYFEGLLIRELP